MVFLQFNYNADGRVYQIKIFLSWADSAIFGKIRQNRTLSASGLALFLLRRVRSLPLQQEAFVIIFPFSQVFLLVKTKIWLNLEVFCSSGFVKKYKIRTIHHTTISSITQNVEFCKTNLLKIKIFLDYLDFG